MKPVNKHVAKPINSFSSRITSLHADYTERWHLSSNCTLPDNDFEHLIATQHKQNFDLWHEEDKAREPNAADKTIAQVKRNIDVLNQSRNDMITQIDEFLEKQIFNANTDCNLPWNSETIGSIIDRLSIASLKVYHMNEQAERQDANQEHVQICTQKTKQLEVQLNDLKQALQEFHDDILAGRKQNKLYRQFKMYNDPTLNPKIYKSSP